MPNPETLTPAPTTMLPFVRTAALRVALFLVRANQH
jgi:hypothetical protein